MTDVVVAPVEQVTLFPFQEEDVRKLAMLPGALNANEMGLGKTYEAIVRDLQIRLNHQVVVKGQSMPAIGGMTLVVAPLTILESTWKDTFERIWAQAKITVESSDGTREDMSLLDFCHPPVVINPKDRPTFEKDVLAQRAGVYIVHWDALRLLPALRHIQWLHVIADECHRAKNRKAQQTVALKKIPATYKTGLSGTPVVNRPDELWSILNWLYPRKFSAYWKFVNRYVLFETEYGKGHQYRKVLGANPATLPELRDTMQTFMVRRLKKDVLKELPDKCYTEIKVDLSPAQRKAYDSMKNDMIAWVKKQEEEDTPLAAPVVVSQLTRLQQFAVASIEFNEDGKVTLCEPSSKIDALMEVLDEAEGEPVVVFSRFRTLVDLVEKRIAGSKLDRKVAVLTGKTSQADRAAAVADFQAGRADVFLSTISAGGVGITLTRASRVVFLDRDWSPAQNMQAEDRLHRIGQAESVQVIDIMARNTVDQGRKQVLEMKWAMIRALLGDSDGPSSSEG